MHVYRRVDPQVERGKVNEHPPSLVVAKETAALLHHVSAQAVKRLPQIGDVEHVPDEHHAAVQRDERRPLPPDRRVGVARHADPFVRAVIGHERRAIRDHVLRGSRVRYRYYHLGDTTGVVWDGMRRG